jgi:hypothetical protein
VRVRSLGVGSLPIHMFDPIYIYRERDRLWLAEFGGGSLGIWLLSLQLVQHFSLRLI